MNRIKLRIRPEWDRETVSLPVRFNEVDAMKVVWHGHYVAYCEVAREEFLARRGLSYERMVAEHCAAPVVRMQLEYLHPARGGDILSVTCAHQPGGEPKLEMVYEIRNPAGRLLCVAESVQVFVDGAGQVFLSAPPPVEALFATIAARRPTP
jgi:acyl-CoA thioester hydrolase